ncbi:hypothetical protein ACQPZQ_08305 [Pseudonocardia sp. CA-142604]|uniref:hypothetical protein n=1 Tax=Pseudonocardia sp. CA-142604 TaxID=3240024 RepID=UPI003D941230
MGLLVPGSVGTATRVHGRERFQSSCRHGGMWAASAAARAKRSGSRRRPARVVNGSISLGPDPPGDRYFFAVLQSQPA